MSMDYRKTYRVAIDDGAGTMTDFAIRTELLKDGKREYIRYYNFEREHVFYGRLKKQTKDGFVFKTAENGWTLTFAELTLQDFNDNIRPNLPQEVSEMLVDLDDVYTWLRQQAKIN